MRSSAEQPLRLGCVYDGRGAGFSVFSSVAQGIEVCVFDETGAEHRHELSAGPDSIWRGYLEHVGPGCLYGYRVHGPWEPAAGRLCRPEFLLLDPYSRAVHGEVKWHDSLFPYHPDNPGATGFEDTAPFMPKSVVVGSDFDWGDDTHPGTELENTIIYETHVRGLTVGHPDIPREIRGTYAGLAHRVAIEYLKGLGVTAVELLPVGQFVHRRRLAEGGLRNYWGYDPINFFAPHSGYSFDRSPGGAVTEFKNLVKSLHAAELEVIVDVVFNHTGEGGAGGAVLSYKGLDNQAYYRLLPGDELRYADYTGTKNTLNSEHPQVRRMIIDALAYWADEMRVDGFRFDLAPALARENGRVRLDGGFFKALREEPSLRDVKLIAEPWDLGEDGYQVGRFPAGWSEWNDRYRDDVRDYWNGRGGAAGRFMARCAGSPDIYREAGRPQQAGVNFVTSHDGFTLHDLVTFETKRNDDNREGGHDGVDDNHAWNCGMEGPVDNPEVNAVRRRQKRNFVATLLLSQGIPMLLGGDELGRTQRGNNNAYCQDNETSWYDWGLKDDGMLEFVKKLVSVRKAHSEFRRSEWPPGGKGSSRTWSMDWYGPAGNRIGTDKAPDAPREPLQALLSGAGEFLLIFNPRGEEVSFQSPAQWANGVWLMLVDTSVDPGPRGWTGTAAPGPQVLAPHSMRVLSRQE